MTEPALLLRNGPDAWTPVAGVVDVRTRQTPVLTMKGPEDATEIIVVVDRNREDAGQQAMIKLAEMGDKWKRVRVVGVGGETLGDINFFKVTTDEDAPKLVGVVGRMRLVA